MKTSHLILSAALGLLSLPLALRAHCDTLDGPVVKAAQRALAERDLNRVLIWVQPSDEAEIKRVFAHVLAVRGLSTAARDLADHFFLETVVRVHRAGEGAPYTGLKPAGGALSAAIVAADRSIETGRIEPVLKLLSTRMAETLQDLHAAMRAAADYQAADVPAGRAWVRAYVAYIHAVEGLYLAMRPAAVPHGTTSDAGLHHGHTPDRE
jgi:hypothetical protein